MNQETEISEESKPPEQRRKEALLAHAERMKADPYYGSADPKSALRVAVTMLENMAAGKGISAVVAVGLDASKLKNPTRLGEFIWPVLKKYIPDAAKDPNKEIIEKLSPPAAMGIVIVANILDKGATIPEAAAIANVPGNLASGSGLKSTKPPRPKGEARLKVFEPWKPK